MYSWNLSISFWKMSILSIYNYKQSQRYCIIKLLPIHLIFVCVKKFKKLFNLIKNILYINFTQDFIYYFKKITYMNSDTNLFSTKTFRYLKKLKGGLKMLIKSFIIRALRNYLNFALKYLTFGLLTKLFKSFLNEKYKFLWLTQEISGFFYESNSRNF